MWRGEREAVKTLRQKVDPNAHYAWFHAASLGEFEQGRPLIEQLRRSHPEMKILLTFFSPSGYEVRKNYEGADIVCYLPLDTPTNARRFLRAIRPEVAFFIKYEFWFNYLHILKHRKVPVYSVSSIFRDDQVFFKWYGKQYGRVLKCFTHFFVQNKKSQELLHNIGIDCVTITGDTRFDRVLNIQQQAKTLPAVERFVQRNSKPTFIVGSSWEADEDIYLPYFEQRPEVNIIIATHVVSNDRLERLMQRLRSLGRNPIRYSQVENEKTIDTNADTLLIDCYGLLSSIYQYADIAYVGGGFGDGLHNILEAAVWGKPVVFGPNNARFQEAQDMKACGGGMEVCCGKSFKRTIDMLLDNESQRKTAGEKAKNYVAQHAGASQRILDFCF